MQLTMNLLGSVKTSAKECMAEQLEAAHKISLRVPGSHLVAEGDGGASPLGLSPGAGENFNHGRKGKL